MFLDIVIFTRAPTINLNEVTILTQSARKFFDFLLYIVFGEFNKYKIFWWFGE